jgi:hypothetical protein
MVSLVVVLLRNGPNGNQLGLTHAVRFAAIHKSFTSSDLYFISALSVFPTLPGPTASQATVALSVQELKRLVRRLPGHQFVRS